MKGIILAGGSGTRLHPVTKGISKQLLPVYDKPMVYHPVSILMLAGIREILIISTPADTPRFKQMLADGSQWGINIQYAIQPRPNGLAEGLIIGREFLAGDPCCFALGDNIFYGHDFARIMREAAAATIADNVARIFAYAVTDPERYGVVQFDTDRRAVSLEEKPLEPKSRYAVTGLYFYPSDACDIATHIRPSDRGELEITDVNRRYLEQARLQVEILGRGIAWLDTGTHDSLLEASLFIQTIEKRQGLKVACLEEISFRLGWMTVNHLESIACTYGRSTYGDYLRKLTQQLIY